MNDQYIHTKVSKETGTVYGDLVDMVYAVGGNVTRYFTNGVLDQAVHTISENAKFAYQNGVLRFFKNGPLSLKISDFLDMENGTRNNNLFVPMEYFAKLVCSVLGLNKPIWGQKLLSPVQEGYVSAGYKLDSYLSLGHGTHYAIDFYHNLNRTPPLYAMGVGEIVGQYTYHSLGETLAIKYNNVIANDGTYYDSLIIRYSHLKSIEEIENGTIVGIENQVATMGASGTGAQKKDSVTGETIFVYHTHLEVSTDTNAPLSTVTEKRPDEINRAIDTTLDPKYIFFNRNDKWLKPDSEIGGSTVDKKGQPWYDNDYLNNIPFLSVSIKN